MAFSRHCVSKIMRKLASRSSKCSLKRKPQPVARLQIRCHSNAQASLRLENKTCIVTGAGMGLGQETVKLFTENGATVIGVDLDENALKDTQKLYVCR